MKKIASIALLSASLLVGSVFAGDQPIVSFSDNCSHDGSFISQCMHYVFGD